VGHRSALGLLVRGGLSQSSAGAESGSARFHTGAVIGRSVLSPGGGRRIRLAPSTGAGRYRRQAEMAEGGPVAVGAGRSALGPGQPLGCPGSVAVLRLWSRPVLPARRLHFLHRADACLGDPHGAAIIEELAWHSYGTDTLVRKMRVFSASMLSTLIWALWHVPLSFIDGYYQNEVVESGVLATVNFPVSMIAFVLVMNWLYYRCGRSILAPVIFHASANMSAALFMTHPDSQIMQTGVLLTFSAAIVIKDRSLFFDRPAAA